MQVRSPSIQLDDLKLLIDHHQSKPINVDLLRRSSLVRNISNILIQMTTG